MTTSKIANWHTWTDLTTHFMLVQKFKLKFIDIPENLNISDFNILVFLCPAQQHIEGWK